MNEQPTNPGIDHLLQPTPEQLAEENEQGRRGYIPERYQAITQSEGERRRQVLETTLQQQVERLDETEIQQRKEAVKRYMLEMLLPPSREGGPDAAGQWLNLTEMLDRVIDLPQAEQLVADVDPRVKFYATSFDKRAVIFGLLVEKIQQTLGEQALTDTHLRDILTNVSQEQLDGVAEQVARSGLPLYSESPRERWSRIIRESRPDQAVS